MTPTTESSRPGRRAASEVEERRSEVRDSIAVRHFGPLLPAAAFGSSGIALLLGDLLERRGTPAAPSQLCSRSLFEVERSLRS